MTEETKLINGEEFRQMIRGAYSAFLRDHEAINRLNVFPVPDGDTGTNMMLTIQSAVKGLEEAPQGGIGFLSKRASDSAILGARGNSGVILAQIFRGLARGLTGKQKATSSELGKAFQYGILYAYRAVSTPVEGTILTVAKGIAKGAHRAVRDEKPFLEILAEAIQAGEEALQRTPDLLPALKAAGVVDAGGQGLLSFLAGCAEGLAGKSIAAPLPQISSSEGPSAASVAFAGSRQETFTIAHPYCTEFIVQPCSLSVAKVREVLQPFGESLIVAPGDELVKVHIHSAHPGLVLEQALTWGAVHKIKIDNMADQHQHLQHYNAAPVKKLSVISVVSGDGLEKIMAELGAAQCIAGGQTMNPPVEDFVAAVHSGQAERYILLPNNKNIVLAAAQAKKLLGERLEMIPTTTIPQGLAALTAFQEALSLEENLKNMKEAAEAVQSGSVTQAVRDSVVQGNPVKTGEYIGLKGSKVVCSAETLFAALKELAAKLVQKESSLITLYYGDSVSEAAAEEMASDLGWAFPALEVEVYYGGQPNYHFYLSVE
ncbi:MAG: DAK2 domain-containing protein [Sporomusaceae bacterium]|nr:DAK2 domain-containing protein [Sporomusaceae bacterium]